LEEIEDKDLARRIREKVNSFNQNGALISSGIMLLYLLVPDFSAAAAAANGSNLDFDLTHFMHKDGSGLRHFMHKDGEKLKNML
tara:strand:+ start:185 stop:436 length:252 start_codon:yes stop_codon:yes gene_type:complete